jgi:hypothetical protein
MVAGVVPSTSPSASISSGVSGVDAHRGGLPLADVLALEVLAHPQVGQRPQHVGGLAAPHLDVEAPVVGQGPGRDPQPPPKNCPLATMTLDSSSSTSVWSTVTVVSTSRKRLTAATVART